MKVIPISTKTQIFEYVAEGLSTRQIAKKVPSVSHMTVTRLRSEHFNGLAKPKAGRPSKLTPYDKRKLVRDMSSGRIQTAVDAAKELSNTMETQLHPEAIRRVLRKSGLKAIKKKKKPFLSRKHRQQRLEFARKYSNWTPEDFKRVIWSDETKINRFGSDGLQWVWKKPKAPLLDCHVQGTFKHGGGSLMLWGCMTSLGIGQACKIEGNMDSQLYCEILSDNLMGTIRHYGWGRDDIVFQQDNDPKHTSKLAKDWFEENGITVMDWPPQSPDLNPIEHLWHTLKYQLRMYSKPPESVAELWERVQDEWNKIPVETVQNLIDSMPKRINAVLKARGGYTEY